VSTVDVATWQRLSTFPPYFPAADGALAQATLRFARSGACDGALAQATLRFARSGTCDVRVSLRAPRSGMQPVL